jgi:hypothetical protein
MPIYIAAEVKSRKKIFFLNFFEIQIVNYHADEVLSKDCEMSSLHQYLSCLPTEIDKDTWEDIIKRALYLFENHPPDTLENLKKDWKIKW